MWKTLKGILAGIQRIEYHLEALTSAVQRAGTDVAQAAAVETRLAELEATVQRRLTQAESLLERAESRFAAARASEERARYMTRGLEEEEEDDELESEVTDFSANVGAGGNGARVPAMYQSFDSGTQADAEARARAFKFGH